MKKVLIDHLSILLSYNVIGDIQYRNRYNGFIGELDFKIYMYEERGNIMLDGGMFLPIKKGANSLDNPIYFTVSSDQPTDYLEVFHRFHSLDCKAMYFLRWDDRVDVENWERADVMGVNKNLLIPPITVYLFDPKTIQFEPTTLLEFLNEFTDIPRTLNDNVPEKVKLHFNELLDRFDLKLIQDLYVQRLIFDGMIGFRKQRGLPSDIDAILKKKDDNIILFEVKEKDLSKRPPVGFGMDIERIKSFKKIMAYTGMQVYYIVKQVADQSKREFISWRSINMTSFIGNIGEEAIEGGTGMRSASSSNPTKICPEEFFRKL